MHTVTVLGVSRLVSVSSFKLRGSHQGHGLGLEAPRGQQYCLVLGYGLRGQVLGLRGKLILLAYVPRIYVDWISIMNLG